MTVPPASARVEAGIWNKDSLILFVHVLRLELRKDDVYLSGAHVKVY